MTISLSFHLGQNELTLLSIHLCHHHDATSLSFHLGQNELSLGIFSSFLISLFLYFEIWVYYHLFKSLKIQRFIVIDLIYFLKDLSYNLSNFETLNEKFEIQTIKDWTLIHFYFVYLIFYFIDRLFDSFCCPISSPNQPTNDSDLPNWWPEILGPNHMIGWVQVQFSVTWLNRVKYGSAPKLSQLDPYTALSWIMLILFTTWATSYSPKVYSRLYRWLQMVWIVQRT